MLTVRARKLCIRLNISTIDMLTEYSASELLECKNVGQTTINNIREELAKKGLCLKGEKHYRVIEMFALKKANVTLEEKQSVLYHVIECRCNICTKLQQYFTVKELIEEWERY